MPVIQSVRMGGQMVKAIDTVREPALVGRLDGQRDRVETDQYIEEPVEFRRSGRTHLPSTLLAVHTGSLQSI
jgi:hypothetical protein